MISTYSTLAFSLGGQFTFFLDFSSMIRTTMTTARHTAIARTITNAASSPLNETLDTAPVPEVIAPTTTRASQVELRVEIRTEHAVSTTMLGKSIIFDSFPTHSSTDCKSRETDRDVVASSPPVNVTYLSSKLAQLKVGLVT